MIKTEGTISLQSDNMTIYSTFYLLTCSYRICIHGVYLTQDYVWMMTCFLTPVILCLYVVVYFHDSQLILQFCFPLFLLL